MLLLMRDKLQARLATTATGSAPAPAPAPAAAALVQQQQQQQQQQQESDGGDAEAHLALAAALPEDMLAQPDVRRVQALMRTLDEEREDVSMQVRMLTYAGAC
jgi:hypothetical protein